MGAPLEPGTPVLVVVRGRIVDGTWVQITDEYIQREDSDVLAIIPLL